jgi:hypothetical protein
LSADERTVTPDEQTVAISPETEIAGAQTESTFAFLRVLKLRADKTDIDLSLAITSSVPSGE